MKQNLVLADKPAVIIQQVHELGEWFGFETRNKYQISDQSGQVVGFAAEQNKGIFGFLLRQFLGHWRRFDIHIFDVTRQKVLTAHHPFRFIFQRMEIFDTAGHLVGAVQQRFSVLTKRFDIQDAQGNAIMDVASPFWKLWTFPVHQRGQPVATIMKKWAGIFLEALTDKDKFMVEFKSSELGEQERQLILAAALFVDLQYFEKKAN